MTRVQDILRHKEVVIHRLHILHLERDPRIHRHSQDMGNRCKDMSNSKDTHRHHRCMHRTSHTVEVIHRSLCSQECPDNRRQ